MALAILEAEKGKKLGNLPFGAVLVKNADIIGSAHAEDITSTDVSAHAELQAIQQACKNLKTSNLKECVLYTTNEPCAMCAGAILQSGISKIVIGVIRGDIPNRFQPKKIGIDELIENYNYKPEIIRGVLKSEVIELFKNGKL